MQNLTCIHFTIMIFVADIMQKVMRILDTRISINVPIEKVFEIKLGYMLYSEERVFVYEKIIKCACGDLLCEPRDEIYSASLGTEKHCEETKQFPDGLYQEDRVDDGTDIIYHQESKRIYFKFKIANFVSFLLSFFALLHAVSAQPSFDSKVTGLFAEEDLLFSNNMMWKAGCNYQYSMSSSISQSITPVNIELDQFDAQFDGSGNVYLQLQICGIRKSNIPKQIGNSKLNDDNDSAEDQHYACITSLWQCSKDIIWDFFRRVFYGNFKSTGKYKVE